jgi:glycosyltransferase involved in cell wall biosynthesis
MMPSLPKPAPRVLLVSNTVMHYRVAVYNYLHRRFAESGWEWHVLTNRLQSQNRLAARFPLEVRPFRFNDYRKRIQELQPDVVILFLHLKDPIIWPLIHWLKWAGIPVISWTKTRNLDKVNNPISNSLFYYINSLSDGLILYAPDLERYLSARQRRKAFPANNTINQEELPVIAETRAEIKKSLGIPFGKVVLFVGRMDVDGGRKRVDHLIEMFRDLEGKDIGLVIVGSGMKPEWQARINPRTTMYLGEVHDPENRQIARIFTMADVCAIPGHVGLGLNQAMYYGLPVVTMEGNQPPEVAYLHSGRNGYMVPAGDTVQLRRRILELLEDDALRARFSAAAREDFFKEASIEGMFQGFRQAVAFVTPRAKSIPANPISSRGPVVPQPGSKT